MSDQHSGHHDAVDALRKDDPPAFAAYAAAAMVSHMEGDDSESGISWAALGHRMEGADAADDPERACARLGSFVRQHTEAPPEALFRFAAAQGIHARAPDAWPELTVAQRAAYGTFASVLLSVDKLAAEEKALAASQNPQIPRSEFLPVEDTILRTSGAATDPHPMIAEERTVTIIPGTGLPPGHAPAVRPAAPAIGGENLQRAAGFWPAASGPAQGPDGSDRRGHGDRLGADAPTVASAGGSPEQGHGSDPSLPFNETGAPPEGQAAESAAATAIATPPAGPAPAPDAPAHRPQEETRDATETGQSEARQGDGVAASPLPAPSDPAVAGAAAPGAGGGLSGGAGDGQQAASEAAHGEGNTAAQAAAQAPETRANQSSVGVVDRGTAGRAQPVAAQASDVHDAVAGKAVAYEPPEAGAASDERTDAVQPVAAPVADVEAGPAVLADDDKPDTKPVASKARRRKRS